MLNIIVPMAGDGARFKEDDRFTVSKPYVEVKDGVPLFVVSTVNLPKDAHYIFVVRDDQYDESNYVRYFEKNFPSFEIVIQKGKLDGAVLTTLVAEKSINTDTPLLVVDSDQYSVFDLRSLTTSTDNYGYDGSLLTFNSDSPDFSYVKTDISGVVQEIAEKTVISNAACAGIYYWSRGSDYVKYAKKLISKNTKYNSEFYVSYVYKEAILDGKKFNTAKANRHFSLGTPDHLEAFKHKMGSWSFSSVEVDKSSQEFRAADIDVDNYITKLSGLLQLGDISKPMEIVAGKTFIATYHPAFWHHLQDGLAQYEVLKKRIPELKIVFIDYGGIFSQVDGNFEGTRFSYVKDICKYYMSEAEFSRTFIDLDFYVNGHSNLFFEEVYFYSDLNKTVSETAWSEHGIYPKWYSQNHEAWVGVHWWGEVGRDPWRREGVNLLRSRFQEHAIRDSSYPKKLYLSRRDAHERHTRILNDPDAQARHVEESISREYDETLLETYFSSKGYHVMSMEGVPYSEQINYFYNADVVASLTGSGMSNLICSRPGTRVIELHVKHNFFFSYEYLADYLDLEFILTDLRVSDLEDARVLLSWDEMLDKLERYARHIED